MATFNKVAVIGAIGIGALIESSTAASAMTGVKYNFAQVRSNQFIETWTSARGGSLHIRVHVANQRGGLASAPFAPIVTLAFQGSSSAVKLNFNVPARQKEQWHEIDIPGSSSLWEQSTDIVASAAENNAARPTQGSWQGTLQYGGALPINIHPN